MTASQVAAHPYPQELPELAQRPEVQVRFDLDPFLLGPCGICAQSDDGFVPDGVMRITWRYRMDIEPSATDVCSAAHGDRELDDLLHHLTRVPAEIVLHVVPEQASPPVPLFPVADADSDEMFQKVDALKKFVQTLPDPGGVEEFRKKVLAAVASLGLARIDQLERAS